MKQSAGFAHVTPSALVFLCFGTGAALQTWSMRGMEMGSNYLIVLGLEAAVALALGTAVFGERISMEKAAGMVLVVLGVALLRMS